MILIIWSSMYFQFRIGLLAASLDVGFLGVAFLVTHFAMHGDFRIDVIGFLCAGLCIIMYASPLSIMVRWILSKHMNEVVVRDNSLGSVVRNLIACICKWS